MACYITSMQYPSVDCPAAVSAGNASISDAASVLEVNQSWVCLQSVPAISATIPLQPQQCNTRSSMPIASSILRL